MASFILYKPFSLFLCSLKGSSRHLPTTLNRSKICILFIVFVAQLRSFIDVYCQKYEKGKWQDKDNLSILCYFRTIFRMFSTQDVSNLSRARKLGILTKKVRKISLILKLIGTDKLNFLFKKEKKGRVIINRSKSTRPTWRTEFSKSKQIG